MQTQAGLHAVPLGPLDHRFAPLPGLWVLHGAAAVTVLGGGGGDRNFRQRRGIAAEDDDSSLCVAAKSLFRMKTSRNMASVQTGRDSFMVWHTIRQGYAVTTGPCEGQGTGSGAQQLRMFYERSRRKLSLSTGRSRL